MGDEIWSLRVSPTCKLVALAIGAGHGRIGAIATVTGLSRRTVDRALAALRQGGYMAGRYALAAPSAGASQWRKSVTVAHSAVPTKSVTVAQKRHSGAFCKSGTPIALKNLDSDSGEELISLLLRGERREQRAEGCGEMRGERGERGEVQPAATPPPSRPPTAPRRGPNGVTPWPAGWQCGDAEIATAQRHGISAERALGEFAIFAAHHQGKASRWAKWDRAWLTWCLRVGPERPLSPAPFRRDSVPQRTAGPELRPASEVLAAAGLDRPCQVIPGLDLRQLLRDARKPPLISSGKAPRIDERARWVG